MLKSSCVFEASRQPLEIAQHGRGVTWYPALAHILSSEALTASSRCRFQEWIPDGRLLASAFQTPATDSRDEGALSAHWRHQNWVQPLGCAIDGWDALCARRASAGLTLAPVSMADAAAPDGVPGQTRAVAL